MTPMRWPTYFLIVSDFINWAKDNKVVVGPGRGSAAGSFVCYLIGITNLDPLEYDLLFERFLNPERISMPDIDIDFDASKRDDVINYVKERYGNYNAMPIMTYGTLAAKQALLSVSKILDINISEIAALIDPKATLKENLTPTVVKKLKANLSLKKVYYDAMQIEGLKKHIIIHAAGVVICNQRLDNIIPITKSGEAYLTG